jgi:hypothetical protein
MRAGASQQRYPGISRGNNHDPLLRYTCSSRWLDTKQDNWLNFTSFTDALSEEFGLVTARGSDLRKSRRNLFYF